MQGSLDREALPLRASFSNRKKGLNTMYVWGSTTFPDASRPTRRLRHIVESCWDNLEFALWLLALCLRATVLLIACRLRDLASRSIRLIFKP